MHRILGILEAIRNRVEHDGAHLIVLTIMLILVGSIVFESLARHNTVAISVLVGIASCSLAIYLVKKHRTDPSTTTVFAHWSEIIHWMIWALLGIFCFANRALPQEPDVQILQEGVRLAGALTISLLSLVTILKRFSVPISLIKQATKQSAIFAMVLWLIGDVGDDIYLATQSDPKILIGALVFFLCMSLGTRASYDSETNYQVAALGVCTMASPISESDKRCIAAHECGHALVYAALDALPADVQMVINEKPGPNGVLGYITGVSNDRLLHNQTFIQWYMLVLLAGKYAEELLLGESSLGGKEDYQKWLALARTFLANHNRGVYYPEPANRYEQELNEHKLQALQAEQLQMLSEFFAMNRDVYEGLVQALLNERVLRRDDLEPMLSQVQFPTNFPRPAI